MCAVHLHGEAVSLLQMYLIDVTNDLPSEPGGVEGPDVEPIQHDHTTDGVIETLQQGSNSGLS